MLDINNPVQWQVRDEKYPTLMPWYTHGMLEELKKWDLSDKTILEWGGGWSSVYFSFYAKRVFTIESNWGWSVEILETVSKLNNTGNFTIIRRDVNEGDQSKVDYYTEIPEDCKPDIVIIDGVLRHECLQKALTLPRPLVIIHDNWQQDGFVCPASEELMALYEMHNFIQENHTDNHGRKWATAYWELK
jgi:hypothetical protein